MNTPKKTRFQTFMERISYGAVPVDGLYWLDPKEAALAAARQRGTAASASASAPASVSSAPASAPAPKEQRPLAVPAAGDQDGPTAWLSWPRALRRP